MNPNAIPKEAHHDIIEDDNYIPPGMILSNTDRKKMLAREHNRAYNAGELTRKTDLVDIVRGAVSHAQHSLGLPVTQSVLSKNR
jgi:hypothetical protein